MLLACRTISMSVCLIYEEMRSMSEGTLETNWLVIMFHWVVRVLIANWTAVAADQNFYIHGPVCFILTSFLSVLGMISVGYGTAFASAIAPPLGGSVMAWVMIWVVESKTKLSWSTGLGKQPVEGQLLCFHPSPPKKKTTLLVSYFLPFVGSGRYTCVCLLLLTWSGVEW